MYRVKQSKENADNAKNTEKMPQSGIVQALYATPAWACFFLMYFILGGYVKYNFLEGGAR